MKSCELDRIAARYGIEIEPVRKIKSRIRRLEKKYDCSSESMWLAISQAPVLETEEICYWLQDYALLRMGNGTDTTGTHTRTTSKSTILV